MVEHVSTREEEDQDQTDCSPDIAVLNERCNVWPRNAYSSNGTEECSGRENVEHVVDGSMNLGVRAVGEMASDPRANLFCRLWPNERALVVFTQWHPKRKAYPLVKSYLIGPVSATA